MCLSQEYPAWRGLGPGRLHHCMRLIGAAERGMQLIQRARRRKAFEICIAEHGSFLSDIAKVGVIRLVKPTVPMVPKYRPGFSSMLLNFKPDLLKIYICSLSERARENQITGFGNCRPTRSSRKRKGSRHHCHGQGCDSQHGNASSCAAGLSGDTFLAHLWATSRTLRIADGPGDVHLGTIAKLELGRAKL